MHWCATATCGTLHWSATVKCGTGVALGAPVHVEALHRFALGAPVHFRLPTLCTGAWPPEWYKLADDQAAPKKFLRAKNTQKYFLGPKIPQKIFFGPIFFFYAGRYLHPIKLPREQKKANLFHSGGRLRGAGAAASLARSRAWGVTRCDPYFILLATAFTYMLYILFL